MSLSLVRVSASPRLSTLHSISSSPHLSSQLPNGHLILCRYKLRVASIRAGIFKVRSFSTFGGVHGDAQFDCGNEEEHEEEEEDGEQIRASTDDEDEIEEEEGTVSSFVLPERWDVLGLGQAMVIPIFFFAFPLLIDMYRE